eukprot:4344880-Pyramimonas_sp.AAC.1
MTKQTHLSIGRSHADACGVKSRSTWSASHLEASGKEARGGTSRTRPAPLLRRSGRRPCRV